MHSSRMSDSQIDDALASHVRAGGIDLRDSALRSGLADVLKDIRSKRVPVHGKEHLRRLLLQRRRWKKGVRAKKERREQEVIAMVGEDPDLDVASPDQAGMLDLECALAQLPEPFKTVVTQYYLHGRSMKEIAAEIGRPDSTTYAINSEGLEMLRKHFRIPD